jgi:hypothetical protein
MAVLIMARPAWHALAANYEFIRLSDADVTDEPSCP